MHGLITIDTKKKMKIDLKRFHPRTLRYIIEGMNPWLVSPNMRA